MAATDCQQKSLTVHVQMILDAGPATLSEQEAWKYMRDELIEIRDGRAGLDKVPVLIAVAQIWNLNHQRESVLRRLARRLTARRYDILANAARAAKGAR